MSIQMLANLYKRLATTTNALPTNKNGMRLVTNMLQICFPVEFYDNVPNICNASKLSENAYEIIIKSLDPLRAKKTFIRKKLGHTAVSAIKASSVNLKIRQKEPEDNAVNLKILTWQSSERLI